LAKQENPSSNSLANEISIFGNLPSGGLARAYMRAVCTCHRVNMSWPANQRDGTELQLQVPDAAVNVLFAFLLLNTHDRRQNFHKIVVMPGVDIYINGSSQ
jgi:hypothetical protein